MVTKKVLMTILHHILNRIDEGIHVVDRNGLTILYNKAMADLEGMRADEVIGQNFRHLFPHMDAQTSTLLQVLKTQLPIYDQSQSYLNREKKEIITINTTLPLYYENQIVGAVEIAKNITKTKELSDEIMRLHQAAQKPGPKSRHTIPRYTFQDLVGENPLFRQAIHQARKAAASSSSVLIIGETGTGKELFVQGIHDAGSRSKSPFIAQNCAAFPESLLEGILFGTSKGSFTGAIDRPGIFEQADGGTILLDEINSMGHQLQAKLLRVLQEGYVRRVGGLKDIPVDVRMIATTNEEPSQLLESGKIRKDLYYRLNVINIRIPPLRERRDDIPRLARFFIEKYNQQLNKNIRGIEPASMNALCEYNWPGNVRELENLIESAINLCEPNDWIDRYSLPESVFSMTHPVSHYMQNILHSPAEESLNLEELMREMETAYIKKALLKTSGNISQAARGLGIKRQTLQHKLKKLKITDIPEQNP